jgi:site-specific DNA-cytosine methylase
VPPFGVFGEEYLPRFTLERSHEIRKHCPDGPRYKALGNSMAVPVMHWIGERIQQVEEIYAD